MAEVPSIASLRREYADSLQNVREHFLRDYSAGSALRRLTEELDRIIEKAAAPYQEPGPFCVLAIGGYGRRELFPHSDVDLLLIYEEAQRAGAEKGMTALLHDLWDMRLHLGQQVWSLEELKKLTPDDFDFALAALDARLVGGHSQLGRVFLEEIFPAFLQRTGPALIEKILTLTQDRHLQFRNTIYQLEPDLKNAPGGLRDYLVGRWLQRFAPEAVFLPFSEEQIEESHDFLSSLRVLLHFISGRNQNQMTHRLQEQLAEHVASQGADTQSQVESLMKSYFLKARVLHGFCLKAMQVHLPGSKGPELELSENHSFSGLKEILQLYCRSLREGTPLSDSSRRAVLNQVSGLAEVEEAELAAEVKELFKPRPGLYRALSELYELGILELLFPEFSSIRARVIRDFYHKYTVDEHSLLAIKNIEDLLSPTERSDFRFGSILAEADQPELLTLALLLHDVGKSREGKHTSTSARMAAKALQRLHFPRPDLDTVVFLIRNHLAMSSVMFKRDLEDRDVIARFNDLISDTSRLKLLSLLTYADIKAVAPDTLNDWKKDLLWQLYVAAYHELTFGYGDQRIEEEDIGGKLLNRLPKRLDRKGFEGFLEGFPLRYLKNTPPEEIYHHYEMAVRVSQEHPLEVRLVDRGPYWELCVVTSDQYYLFSKIVGLLSYFDMNILRGYGFANRGNTVLDFFQFTDTRDVFQLNPGEKARFHELLEEAVAGRVSIDRMLEGKERSVVFRNAGPRFKPTIYFDGEHSDQYSVMEIVAPDSVGLLYRIGHQISNMRCNIELVLISTEGDKAVDVFYLTHNGSKLSHAVEESLRERIMDAIG